MPYAGKVVLVTGASSGIGKAASVAFARAGAKVVLLAKEEPRETLEEIHQSSGEGMALSADVSRADQVDRAFERLLSQFGRLDCAFNNAGIEGDKRQTAEQTEPVFDKVMSVNLKGTWLCMQREIKLFQQQKSIGAIVNTASIFSFVGYPNSSVYAASKAAVLALTRSAALEYACEGIRINAVCPGDIKTPMTDKGLAEMPGGRDIYAQSRVTGRLGRPEEVASTVLYLCSEEASYVIGQSFVVDGGYLAR